MSNHHTPRTISRSTFYQRGRLVLRRKPPRRHSRRRRFRIGEVDRIVVTVEVFVPKTIAQGAAAQSITRLVGDSVHITPGAWRRGLYRIVICAWDDPDDAVAGIRSLRRHGFLLKEPIQ